MTKMHDTFKSIVRIEKETYDLYRLLDKEKLNVDVLTLLRRHADHASRNLQTLEEKCLDLEPSLATYIQHFVPNIEFVVEDADESSLLRSIIDNRRELQSLYSDLSSTHEHTEMREVFRTMADNTATLLEM